MEIPALNDRYKGRKLLSQQQMFPKQDRGKRACLGSNQGLDDLYLEFNYLKTRYYLFLFQEMPSVRPWLRREVNYYQ